MEGLCADLLPRDDRARELLGVRLHRFDAAVERALREWEAVRAGLPRGSVRPTMSAVRARASTSPPRREQVWASSWTPSGSATGSPSTAPASSGAWHGYEMEQVLACAA